MGNINRAVVARIKSRGDMIPNKMPQLAIVSDEEELKRRGYVQGSILGEGSYAKVRWATSQKEGGRKVALKIINKKKAPADFQQKFLPRELKVLKQLDHPHIVRLYEVFGLNDKIVMVMEMAGHGDLLEYVRLRGAVPEDKARLMFAQLVSAVDYLHAQDIVHRDLKCENVLLDSANNVKLSDFGFARVQLRDEKSRTFCGSAAYAAPELLQGIAYHGTASDVWSLGVILYILVCGTMPFDDSNIRKMVRIQLDSKFSFPRAPRLSDQVKQLILSVLEAKVALRYTAPQIVGSAWIEAGFGLLQKSANNSNQTVPACVKAPHEIVLGSNLAANPMKPQVPVDTNVHINTVAWLEAKYSSLTATKNLDQTAAAVGKCPPGVMVGASPVVDVMKRVVPWDPEPPQRAIRKCLEFQRKEIELLAMQRKQTGGKK